MRTTGGRQVATRAVLIPLVLVVVLEDEDEDDDEDERAVTQY